MNLLKNIFCVIFFLLFVKSSQAQDGSQLYWYYTSADTLNFHDVSRLKFNSLKTSRQAPQINNRGTYWFKVFLNDGEFTEDRIFHVLNPHLDTVILYAMKKDLLVYTDTAGNNFKADKGGGVFRHTQFAVPHDIQEVYFKTNFKKDIWFPIKVTKASVFGATEKIEFLYLGLYYGFLLMVLAFNLFFYFVFKDIKHIYYNIFLLLTGFTFAYADGTFALFTNNSWWLNNADVVIHPIVALSGVIFANAFLDLNKFYPRLKWWGLMLAVCMLLSYLLHLAFGGTYLFYTGDTSAILLVTLYWSAGLVRFRQDIFARFFVIAYGMQLISTYDFFIASKMGWEFLNLSHLQFKISSIVEMVIISAGIAYRVRLLHKENSKQRKEINRYITEKLKTENEHIGNSQTDVFAKIQQKYRLSNREVDVLKEIANGYGNSEICERLCLSSNTIKTHIRNIYEKLEINNRAQAVIKVLKR